MPAQPGQVNRETARRKLPAALWAWLSSPAKPAAAHAGLESPAHSKRFPRIGNASPEFFQGLENLARIFPRLGKKMGKYSKLWKSAVRDEVL